VTSAFAIDYATHEPPSDTAKWLAIGMAAFGILFGPVAFFAHFFRFCLVTMTVSPGEGLILGKRRTVKWSEVRSVEHLETAFKGLIRVHPMLLFVTVGCWAIVYYVVLPSFALFTPWHSRIVIVLDGGERIILRDLIHADDFVKDVSQYVRPGSTAPGA